MLLFHTLQFLTLFALQADKVIASNTRGTRGESGIVRGMGHIIVLIEEQIHKFKVLLL